MKHYIYHTSVVYTLYIQVIGIYFAVLGLTCASHSVCVHRVTAYEALRICCSAMQRAQASSAHFVRMRARSMQAYAGHCVKLLTYRQGQQVAHIALSRRCLMLALCCHGVAVFTLLAYDWTSIALLQY
jgi:hypothetical protein